MSRLANLKVDVKALYSTKNPNRDEWTDWLIEHHVFIVADFAAELSERFGADKELSCAAALLHDIGDVKTSRFNPDHKEISFAIARDLLEKNKYSEEETQLIVEDAIRYHSCRDSKIPASIEGKVLSTADSLAHLKTDFYIHGVYSRAKREDLTNVKAWVIDKLEQDYNVKIQFDEIRKEVRTDYEMYKTLFSR